MSWLSELKNALTGKTAKKAADAQVQASKDAIASNEKIFQQQTQLQEPFRQAGMAGQNEFLRLLGLGGDANSAGYGSLKSGFMPTNWMDTSVDPGYNFRFSEGLRALQHSSAARGGLMSGKFLTDVTNYGQGAASQEYQNAFNRYQTSRNATLDPLAQLFGSGQRSTDTLTQAAGNMGALNSELITGAGNARASGYIGRGNAMLNTLSLALGIPGQIQGYQLNSTINDYYKNQMPRPA